MKSSSDLLLDALIAMGANGLCNPVDECGCGLDELAPCGCLNLSDCVAAKWVVPEKGTPEYEDEDFRDGYYRMME